MNKIDIKELFKGIITQNPVFVIVLGLCPTLAVTTQTINGIGMGIAVIFVLTFSNIFISLLKNFIPPQVRIPCYIVLIATFVTIVQLVIKAFFPELDKSLGIFIPLIVVNCIILGRAEAFASKNNVINSIFDAIGMGLGFTISLTIIGLIREILGNGTITLKLADMGTIIDLRNIIKYPALVFIMPPGGFLVMGLLLAFFQNIKNSIEESKKIKQKQAKKSEA